MMKSKTLQMAMMRREPKNDAYPRRDRYDDREDYGHYRAYDDYDRRPYTDYDRRRYEDYDRHPYTDYDRRRYEDYDRHSEYYGGYADRDRKSRRYEDDDQPFTEQTAEEWVAGMVDEDPAVGRGGKWKPDDVRPFAKKYGIQTTGKQFAEFYAMMNAMYSDYSEVAKRYGVTDPGFFAEMAKAFIHDKDANPDKVQAYYEYVVKHD